MQGGEMHSMGAQLPCVIEIAIIHFIMKLTKPCILWMSASEEQNTN
jgi:hypothetical protein